MVAVKSGIGNSIGFVQRSTFHMSVAATVVGLGAKPPKYRLAPTAEKLVAHGEANCAEIFNFWSFLRSINFSSVCRLYQVLETVYHVRALNF